MAMSPDRIAHAISFLMGEVHALVITSQVLARAHPYRDAFVLDLDKFEQLGLANIESQPVSDAVIEGYKFVLEGIHKALKDAAEGL